MEAVHPGSLISPQITNAIRKFSAEAEKLCELHREQLRIIYEQNWFNLFVPKEYGGLELNLIDALQIEESLAWIDGSFGWTVTLCAGANWFVGFLQPEAAKEIFSNEKACLAGSGRPSGIAKKEINDSYKVYGFWKYATGAPHATIFTANCLIEKDGKQLQNDTGDPLISSFWFKRDEVIIHKDWNSIGMIATASNSFEIKQLNVPGNRTFIIASEHSFLHQPIYKFPFLQFAETTLSVNISGMAVCFLDLCEKLFASKNKNEMRNMPAVNEKLDVLISNLHSKRNQFYSAVEKAWNELMANNAIDAMLLTEISLASRQLANTARQAVDEMYPYCGMIAANKDSDINRVWRNIHTASQHSLLNSIV